MGYNAAWQTASAILGLLGKIFPNIEAQFSQLFLEREMRRDTDSHNPFRVAKISGSSVKFKMYSVQSPLYIARCGLFSVQ